MGALWKTYPRGSLRSLMFEVLQKEADGYDDRNRRPATPAWKRDGERVGCYAKLAQMADASTGYQKLSALMSGMTAGAREGWIL